MIAVLETQQRVFANAHLPIAEARHQASADSVQWQRKGVPLHIVQSKGPMERTLTDLVALAKVLYQEEQKAFHAAMAEATDRCNCCPCLHSTICTGCAAVKMHSLSALRRVQV